MSINETLKNAYLASKITGSPARSVSQGRLGVKTSIIGLVEGVGDATPQLLQPVSGWLSDKLKKRKLLVVVGQSMRSLIALLFFAHSWLFVLLIRFLDRSGKGIQVAPRDALISLSAKPQEQGRAFGLSQTLGRVPK